MTDPIAIAQLSTTARRPCVGLGVQADCYIYDDVNREFGVDAADYARWERRIKLLRPGIARIFLPTSEFNPSGDRKTYDWDTVEMQRQYRNLAVLKEAGARVNLCMGPWTNKEMTEKGSERLAVDLLEHLVSKRGFDHIGWLSLFNEPDAIYAPDTALNADLKARGFGGGLPLADYVAKHRAALALLQARGLAKHVRLVVGDMAWPPARRLEWLQLLAAEFGPDDVSYSFHHYAPDEDRYDQYFVHPGSQPFRPPPLADEMHGYRDAVGEAAELICWEFNLSGWNMGGSAAFMGVGLHGEDHAGSISTAVAHTRKALTMLAGGMDGLSHWCVGDMFYRSGLKQGVMYCGLWRYKWESWVPRPVYFYYAALMEAFPPGCRTQPVDGLPSGVTGLAARHGGRQCVALLNQGPLPMALRWSAAGEIRRLRITPDRLPRRPDILSRETVEEELPLSTWEAVAGPGRVGDIALETHELTVLKSQNHE